MKFNLQEVKFMRKFFVMVLALGVVAGLAASSFAAFSGLGKSTVTASVSFTGSGQVSVSVKLSAGTSIYWDPAAITLGSTDWKAAYNYLIMESTITDATGGVQIYTNNKATDANPKYNGTGDPAGLVGYDTGLSTGSAALSMCWRIVDYTTTTVIMQGAPIYPDRLWEQQLGDSFPCYLWMKDKATASFIDGEDYVTMKESVRGAHFSEGEWGTMQSPDYIYLGAKFKNAVTPKNYKTNTLRIETFTE